MRSGPEISVEHMRALFSRMPVFEGFRAEEVEALARGAELKAHPKGEIIFREGDAAEGVFVLIEGGVRIFRRTESASELDLAVLDAVDYFGELALFDGAPRSASVMATRPTMTLFIKKADFECILSRSPGRAGKMLADMSRKLRLSNQSAYTQMLETLTVRAQMEHERYRSLSQMVAGVAHELNTPLGIVATAVSVLVERLKDGEIADALEAARLIEQNLGRANKLVETFKSLSVKQVRDSRAEHDLSSLLSEIIELFSPRARAAKLEIVLVDRLPPNERSWIGYAECLTQVLHNLLANIERYAYPSGGGGRVEIEVRSEAEETPSFAIAVRDFGVGIPKENLSRVFEAFFTTGRSRGGTGLGLSIVQTLVRDALRGTVVLSSEAGHGTEVAIRFPRTILDGGTA